MHAFDVTMRYRETLLVDERCHGQRACLQGLMSLGFLFVYMSFGRMCASYGTFWAKPVKIENVWSFILKNRRNKAKVRRESIATRWPPQPEHTAPTGDRRVQGKLGTEFGACSRFSRRCEHSFALAL